MGQSQVAAIFLICIALCTGTSDTSDRKSSIQYTVKNLDGNVASPLQNALNVIKRDSIPGLQSVLDPDAPLNRMKRIDLDDHIGLKRKKRSVSNVEPALAKVKRENEADLKRVKRESPETPLKRVKRIDENAETLQRTKRETSSNDRSTEVVKRDASTEHIIANERTKRDALTAAKPIEHTKRDIPTAAKLIEINKRGIENTAPAMKPLVKRDVKIVKMPPEKHDIGSNHDNTVKRDIPLKVVKRDTQPLAPIVPEQPKLHVAEGHVRSLAENLEDIRREKRAIRKAQVALDREVEVERETRMRKRRELRHLREKMEDREDWSALIHG